MTDQTSPTSPDPGATTLLDLLSALPPEILTAGGVVTAGLLALVGAGAGHLVSARAGRRTSDTERSRLAGELALDVAREARADVASIKAELKEVRVESDQRHAQYGLAHRHASVLHIRWPEAVVADRPAWPTELAPPI